MNAADRAQVIAERDAQIVAWLAKKAHEYGTSNRENRTKAEAVWRMADKLSRGAVRDTDGGLTELAALRARVAELEAQLPAVQEPENPFRPCGCPKRFDRHAWGCPTVPEDPHNGPNHHDYALGRDLPFIPQQVTGRCPNGHTFEDCTCGGAS